MSAPAIVSSSAITRVQGDGQRTVALMIELDRPVVDHLLGARTFAVEGRTVVRASATDAPSSPRTGVDGRFVIVELDPDDADAGTWAPVRRSGPLLDEQGVPRGPRVGDAEATGILRPARLRFTQVADVVAVDGTRRPASATVHETVRSIDPLVDRFEQRSWRDPATGLVLRYDLFLPEGHDRPGARFPLVLFMHDAGAIAEDTRGTLAQGLGAVAWASPEDQERHPCFVLAPQYDDVVVDDRYLPSPAADATRHLLEHLVTTAAIDPDRVYATGQSMGAMIAMGLAIAHPGLFAAVLAVGGQWPAGRTAPLAATPLWVAVSEGDAKAYPEQLATIAVLEAEGAVVDRAVLDGRADPAELERAAERLATAAGTVKLASFLRGTVDALGRTDPLSEHLGTWRVAYAVPAIRDWVMRQRR